MAKAIVNEVELEQAARLSAGLDDALMVVSETIAGNEPAELALDRLVRHIEAHSALTWHFARWWDIQTGPVTTDTATRATVRWLQVLAAFRAAMEL